MTWGYDYLGRLHYAWLEERPGSFGTRVDRVMHVGRVGGTDIEVHTFSNVGSYNPNREGLAKTGGGFLNYLCFAFWVDGEIYEACDSQFNATSIGSTFDGEVSVVPEAPGDLHVVDATPTALRYTPPTGSSTDIETYSFAATPRIQETAITLDSSGDPHVLYIIRTAGQDYVKYARLTSTGWSVTQVENITNQNNGPTLYDGNLAILATPTNDIHLAWTRRWVQSSGGFSTDREDVRHAVATAGSISAPVNVDRGYAMTGGFGDALYNTNVVELALDADDEVMLGYGFVASGGMSTSNRETWLARYDSTTQTFSTARFSGTMARKLGRLGYDDDDRPAMLHESWLRYLSYCP